MLTAEESLDLTDHWTDLGRKVHEYTEKAAPLASSSPNCSSVVNDDTETLKKRASVSLSINSQLEETESDRLLRLDQLLEVENAGEFEDDEDVGLESNFGQLERLNKLEQVQPEDSSEVTIESDEAVAANQQSLINAAALKVSSKEDIQRHLMDKPKKELPDWQLKEMNLGPPVPLANINKKYCYMNAVLQMAFNDPDFFHYVIARKDQSSNVREGAKWYYDQQLDKNDHSMNLANCFVGFFNNKEFMRTDIMHDASEVIPYLFPKQAGDTEKNNPFKNEMLVSVQYPKPLSLVEENGVSVKKENPCVKTSSESSFMSQIPLITTDDQVHSFHEVVAKEFNRSGDVIGDDKHRVKVQDNQGSHRETLQPLDQKTRFKTLPKKWICHFKRFNYDESGVFKDGRGVGITKQFILDEKCVADNKKGLYEVTSFIVHGSNVEQGHFGRRGSGNYGHYITYLKKEGQWYRCDDETIKPVSEDIIDAELPYCYLFNSQLIDENPSPQKQQEVKQKAEEICNQIRKTKASNAALETEIDQLKSRLKKLARFEQGLRKKTEDVDRKEAMLNQLFQNLENEDAAFLISVLPDTEEVKYRNLVNNKQDIGLVKRQKMPNVVQQLMIAHRETISMRTAALG